MLRNVVSVIGSAGNISPQLRSAAEDLGHSLAVAGYDIVTGGMDGVMRAVARGYNKSHSDSPHRSQLIEIKPGWDEEYRLNPYSPATVQTTAGTLRNHLVVQAADLIIVLGGKSGTLSEIALGWQAGKPLACLVGYGGWAETLANTALDDRRTDQITACKTVPQLLNWVERMRPKGVFGDGRNRGFYPLEVPALHRIRPKGSLISQESAEHKLHAHFGMSLEFDDCVRRLKTFDRKVDKWNHQYQANTVGLVTFDDGWKDVLKLRQTLIECVNLQPVVFVGSNQLTEHPKPLPLQRLYHHYSHHFSDWDETLIADFDKYKQKLKSKSEIEQHSSLDDKGIEPFTESDWLLTYKDLMALKQEGWIVASHGPAHENLSKWNSDDLQKSLTGLTEQMEEFAFHPWLAWPEGKQNAQSAGIAYKAGFVAQFGLLAETPYETLPNNQILRTLWR